MKKMKLAVVFAALVSVFGFSSCLNDGDSSPRSSIWWVNIDQSYLGNVQLRPDGFTDPDIVWIPTSSVLSQYGIPEGSKRAWIEYTVPEGQDPSSKKIQIALVAGSCTAIPVENISERADTLTDYTSNFKSFLKFYDILPALYTNGRYLMVNCSFTSGNNSPKFGLLGNRVSNDTLYLDLKLKTAEGSYNNYQSFFATNYDLTTCRLIHEMMPDSKDSIYVTVRALTSEYGNQVQLDSMTTRAKYPF